MKKLRLKALSLGAREILSREQLRSINGGCSGSALCGDGETCNDDSGMCEPGSGSGGGGCSDGNVLCGTCGCHSAAYCENIMSSCL